MKPLIVGCPLNVLTSKEGIRFVMESSLPDKKSLTYVELFYYFSSFFLAVTSDDVAEIFNSS